MAFSNTLSIIYLSFPSHTHFTFQRNYLLLNLQLTY